MGGAIDVRSGRRAAHGRDDLLHRDAAAAKRRRPCLLAHADAGRCRRRAGGGAHGGRPIGPARTRDAGQDDLIASTHRAYAVAEKEKPGNGVGDPFVVVDALDFAARRTIAFDMEKLAVDRGTMISAAMLGALAGSGALPFERSAYEDIVRKGARAPTPASPPSPTPMIARAPASARRRRSALKSALTSCRRMRAIPSSTALSGACARNCRKAPARWRSRG